MPPHLIHAFLSAEDRNFFNHNGISIKGIIRSTLVNLYHRKRMQGASTITQQLIRLLYFYAQKTFQRKIQEQFVALIVERQFTKEQILETYLNHIYFGCGIYGVQAAAQRFWAVDLKDINAAQAATLASIVRNPNYYCPLLKPENTIKRRNVILSLMHQLGYITTDEYRRSCDEPLNIIESKITKNLAPHLQETIRLELEKLFGKEKVYGGGFRVQTTLNRHIQKLAEKGFKKHLTKLRKELHPQVDGGLITLDVSTGAIKALIGGYDYSTSQFNRALKAKRQLGSSIKPIIYASAINQGASFIDIEIDEPIIVEMDGSRWEPRNSTRKFEGEMTLAYALSKSNNIVTIKTLLKYGIDEVIELAHKMGIDQELPPYPSLALGCIDVTLLEATGTFNTFANNGIYVKPYYIKWIKDEWGTKVYRHREEKRFAMTQTVCDQVIRVMTLSIKRICKALGITLPFEAFYKTGTTNDSRNTWILGSTPTLTTGLYLGTDDNQSPGENIFAIRTAFPIWHTLHEKTGSQPSTFSYSPQLQEVVVDAFSGKPAHSSHQHGLHLLIEKKLAK